MSFPISAELYLRQKEIDKLKRKYQRNFKPKAEMAMNIVKEIFPYFEECHQPDEPSTPPEGF
jgi:SRSO17 transposase